MGKNVVVSGALGGIGRATVYAFAANGYDVMINYRDPNKETEAEMLVRECMDMGVRAICCRADVSKPQECELLIDKTMEIFERVDVLVNVAGKSKFAFITNHSLEDYYEVIENTQNSVFYMMRQVAPIMKRQKTGHIFNVTSLAATHGSQGMTAYAAAKAAVEAMTRCVARELARSGVRVNAICPGAVNTEAYTGNMVPEQIKEVKRAIAIGRMSEPSEIAEFIVALCSEKLDSITGEVLNITGGMVI